MFNFLPRCGVAVVIITAIERILEPLKVSIK